MTRKTELMTTWAKGVMPPDGYVAWQDWAKAQHYHGLKQRQCIGCCRWRFPQELDEKGACLSHSAGEKP
jgi:hypothetical protein